jgi:hypothetical protein
VLVLLGDEPIRHFLAHHDSRWRRLRDFDGYGRLHSATIGAKRYHVLPLAHPRQVAGLGTHSGDWRRRHDDWKERASGLLSLPHPWAHRHPGLPAAFSAERSVIRSSS